MQDLKFLNNLPMKENGAIVLIEVRELRKILMAKAKEEVIVWRSQFLSTTTI